jgi:ketosteroid isomerase-like protein
MQEQDITTLIDTLYASFLRGDLEAILEIVSDDTELIVYGPAELPFTGQFRGQSGTRQFLEALVTTQDDIKAEINERIVQGNNVVVIGSYSAKIKATGKAISTPIAHVWTVENGKITRFLDFFDTAAAQTAYRQL